MEAVSVGMCVTGPRGEGGHHAHSSPTSRPSRGPVGSARHATPMSQHSCGRIVDSVSLPRPGCSKHFLAQAARLQNVLGTNGRQGVRVNE